MDVTLRSLPKITITHENTLAEMARPPNAHSQEGNPLFLWREPPIREAAARLETRSLSPGRYIGKYTFEVNAEA